MVCYYYYYSKRKKTQNARHLLALTPFDSLLRSHTTFVQQSQKVTEKPAWLETSTECVVQS